MSSCVDVSKDNLEKRIIIVGAGIAGLACGFHLRELGFSNVCILEARSCVGGRIKTIHFGDYFIEMGAQWIHGEKENVIYELAADKGLVNESAPNYFNAIMNFGTVTNESEISDALVEFLDDKVDSICEGDYPDPTVLSYLKQHFENFIAQKASESHKEHLTKVFNWYCKLLCELNGCSSLSKLSLHHMEDYKQCDGSQTVELKSGYSSILNLLLEKIPSNWLINSKRVNKIDYSEFKMLGSNSSALPAYRGKPKIKVVCDYGETFMADHVVVTVPLGYLKQHADSLFVPPLSERKQKAIQCLGFDVVNKIFLEFAEPFWDDGTIFNVLWSDTFDDTFIKNVQSEEELTKKSWLKSINRFAYTASHPKMLCAWIVGEGAAIMESLTDYEISYQCMKLLELLLKIELPRPCRVLRSAWLSDENTYGSYSYLSLDCYRERVSNKDLAEPQYSALPCSMHPLLLFAGEATHVTHFSTVHGAYESGLREAKRLFQHYGY